MSQSHAESVTVASPADGFAKLHGYRAIAWDLDGTLIGHPASPRLHSFIRSRPELRHVIVTFRARKLEAMLWQDLANTGTAPAPSCFETVLAMADDLYEAFHRFRRLRRLGRHAGPPTPVEAAYVTWKGEACAAHGLTVLVDDMPDLVRPGCELHRVALLHPDDFLDPAVTGQDLVLR